MDEKERIATINAALALLRGVVDDMEADAKPTPSPTPSPDPTPAPSPSPDPKPDPNIIISDSLDVIAMQNTNTIHLMGRAVTPDNYIARVFWEVTEIIAGVVPVRFPYRKGKPIEIVRGTPWDGDGGTHPMGGCCLDLHYPTFADTDHTQCGEFRKEMVEIWTADPYTQDGELNEKFDPECTLFLFQSYYLFFPYLDACTMPKIKEAMGAYGRKYDYIGTALDQANMYHGTHLHLGILGGHAVPKINKNVTMAQLLSV